MQNKNEEIAEKIAKELCGDEYWKVIQKEVLRALNSKDLAHKESLERIMGAPLTITAKNKEYKYGFNDCEFQLKSLIQKELHDTTT